MSKSKKYIILFTNIFPYGVGEKFLETELKYLSNEFVSITIFPFNKSEKVKTLAENIVVNDLLIDERSFIALFNAFVSVFFSRDFFTEISKFNCHLFLAKLYKLVIINTKANFIKQKIKQWIKSQDINIENTIFYTYWLTSAAYALGRLKNEGVNLVLVSRVHGYDLYEIQQELHYLPYHKESIAGLDRLYCISEDGYRYLQSKYQHLIRNLDDILRVKRLGVEKQQINPERERDRNVFRIVSCSSIIAIKRLDLIADAISLLNLDSIIIEWHHIGDGKDRKAIQEKINNISSNNIKVVLYRYLENYKVMELYNNKWFDLFINVSNSEGIPVSIMEAMSFGIPVMARNVGGISEIVNNENGMLLNDVISVKQLSHALILLMESGEELEKKRKKAFNTWQQYFNAAKNYKDFVNELKKV